MPVSEAGSSIDHILFSLTAGLSFDMDGPALACCCEQASAIEGAGLDGPA